ncbi:hypothetical protein [Deinococcus fonticola]|uniref:hypothetical protein n=1 Tax=Deinococcus fonticola TaxID=2528713 RepID=UPI0010752186|nr:hypothetical protein [Deinococcus fonticola]
MNEHTFHRANQDRIVIHAGRQGWRVTYYRATPIRGSWLRRLLAPPAIFQDVVSAPNEIHSLLMRHGLHLTRAEMQRLSSMLAGLRAANEITQRRVI